MVGDVSFINSLPYEKVCIIFFHRKRSVYHFAIGKSLYIILPSEKGLYIILPLEKARILLFHQKRSVYHFAIGKGPYIIIPSEKVCISFCHWKRPIYYSSIRKGLYIILPLEKAHILFFHQKRSVYHFLDRIKNKKTKKIFSHTVYYIIEYLQLFLIMI